MALKSANTEIFHSLMELEDGNFDTFCFQLRDSSVEPRIRAGEVEKKNRLEITKLLVSRCTEAGALRRTINTLRDIGCNNEALELESRNASRLDVSSQVQMNGTLNKEAPSGRESEPPAKPLKQANGATQAKPSQTVVKQSPKPETAWSGELLLFGKHAGKSFEWLLQNHENYAVYVVATHLKERDEGNMSQNKLMKNKDALAEYVRHFSHVMEEVHFYREGLAPIGFGTYTNVTRQDLYNSTDERKKSYVNWLRSLEGSGKGDQMEAVLKYISHRDKKGATVIERVLPAPSPDLDPS
ncbi:uncharacterized protein LOC129411862 [Boleophthalmus pectinirostris]|uniref:uncharacterized protein LOC129411862 n=1 Tax=Boleophthalmus pectinirostris TaxID=150288 RepID=UPI00242C67F0|nr:uncharacterized protein LOC129411862 [Boleophthalmus pectinirostris]XP_055020022.1 uncharacterized protein LOC129411862 [Boleophthalmus pectinirostris]